MLFKDYFYLNESPDAALIYTDEVFLNLNYDHPNSYGFGFVNTDIKYKTIDGNVVYPLLSDDNDSTSQPIVEKNQFMSFKKMIHSDMKMEWFYQLTDKQLNVLEKRDYWTDFMYEQNARLLFYPAGRIWLDVENLNDSKVISLISFWATDGTDTSNPTKLNAFMQNGKVKAEHIKTILNKFNLTNKADSVFIEFINYKGKKVISFSNFLGQTVEDKNDTDKEISSVLAQAHAKPELKQFVNKFKGMGKNFGSPYEAELASKLKYPTTAEMKRDRNPYGESKNIVD